MLRGQLRALLALGFALVGVLLVAPTAGADPAYPPTTPTACRVEVPSAIVGERVVVRVRVAAATNLRVTGDLEVTVTSGSTRALGARAVAAAPWTTTVRYEGFPIRVVGPRLARGDHLATVRFRPDASALRGCEAAVRFDTGRGVPTGDPGPGTLPNTGGPDQAWLLVGLALVTLGAGMLHVATRSGGRLALAGAHRK